MTNEISAIIAELDELVDELAEHSGSDYPYQLVEQYADTMQNFLVEHPEEFFKWLLSQRGKAA